MNLTNQLRNIASDDSRRFAKGTICEILTDSIAHAIINKYQLGPPGIFIAAGEPPWFDPRIGKFYAIPRTSLKEFREEIKAQGSSNPSNPDLDLVRYYASREQPLVDFLRQKLVICTINKGQLIDGKVINPTLYDVIIETVDINQTVNCSFIERSINNFTDTYTLDDDT